MSDSVACLAPRATTLTSCYISISLTVLRAPNARDAEGYECPATPTTVRMMTPNERVHVVMSSLLDPVAFPAAAFADLYHGRWRIEEAFKRIKHQRNLEYTSGWSWHAARQDFCAKTVFDKHKALAAYAATAAFLDPSSR